MTDFPEDILIAAEKIIMQPMAENEWNSLAYYVGEYKHRAVSVIARAIMAERERCAQIATTPDEAMRKKYNDGGTAYPASRFEDVCQGGSIGLVHYSGLSIRDYFAGQALAGYLASVSTPEVMTLCTNAAKARGMEEEPFVAKIAYTFADAMLLERQETVQSTSTESQLHGAAQ